MRRARRILDALERGESRQSICRWARTSNSTLVRIIRHKSAYGGAAREPAQGQGKRDDPRWHFAGSRGRTNLAELETIRTTHGDRVNNDEHSPHRESLIDSARGRVMVLGSLHMSHVGWYPAQGRGGV